MKDEKAIVRRHIEKIAGVSRTWFEWDRRGERLTNVLVVEVDFDTDPNSLSFARGVLDAIEEITIGALKEDTMLVGGLRIVPASRPPRAR
jgi:hypothetical protein